MKNDIKKVLKDKTHEKYVLFTPCEPSLMEYGGEITDRRRFLPDIYVYLIYYCVWGRKDKRSREILSVSGLYDHIFSTAWWYYLGTI